VPSEVEAERRSSMATFVIEERVGFYTGRVLKIPVHRRPLRSVVAALR
jgi:hypothetical protein